MLECSSSSSSSSIIVIKYYYLQGFLLHSNITNFTTDWNNGLLLSALIDKLHPGLIPDLSSLDSNNGIENTQRALKNAEIHFDIPQVLSYAALYDLQSYMHYTSKMFIVYYLL